MEKLTLQPLSTGCEADSILEYFKFTLNLGYGLCLIPFRLKSDAPGSKCKVVKRRWHQIACGIMHALILYESLMWLWMMLDVSHPDHMRLLHNHEHQHQFAQGGDSELEQGHSHSRGHGHDHRRDRGKSIDTLQHFAVSLGITSVLGFLYTFWRKGAKFEVLIRLVDKTEFCGAPGGNRRRQRFKIYLLGTAISLTCMGLAATDTTLHETSILDGRVVPFIQSYFVEGQRMYMFQSDEVLPDTISSAYDRHGLCYMALAIFGAGVHMVVAVPQFFIHHVLVDLFVVLSAIALWSSVKQFLAYARKHVSGCGCDVEDERGGMEQVLAQYEILKSLVRTVNGITGVLFLFVISISIPFYVLWAANSYFNIHNSIHFFIYFGLFFILLAIAADTHAKAGRFYNWICTGDHADKVPASKMVSLSMDMSSNQIALRGAGVFTLTYRFFGTILSLLVTYTVIIIQYQNSCNGTCGGGSEAPAIANANTSTSSMLSP